MTRKLTKKSKKAGRGQVLPVALITGAVVLTFALAMVYMLRNSIKLSTKITSGTLGTLNADGVVDKGINALSQGNNWGTPPGLTYVPINGYKFDKVYTDIPDSQYVVQIDAGNLLKPPGDQAYERTITVDAYQMPRNYPTPSILPTPWVRTGGQYPSGFISHRTIQSVLRRGSVSAAIIAGGQINVGGHWRVFWGDMYDYYQPGQPGPVTCLYPCTSVIVVDVGTEPLGPGYPAIHTKDGCIASSGSCGGCFGGSGSANSTVCLTTDTGAQNCKLYPNDPNMPPKPSVDLESLKSTARKIYVPGTGQPGFGRSSLESGYFYSTTCASCAGINSISAPASLAGAANEANHTYNVSSDPMKLFFGGSQQMENVITRMAQNLLLPSSWGGNDDLVCFVDTTDGLDLQSDQSNACDGGSTIGLKDVGFQGTLVILGSTDDNGGSNFGINTTLDPPDATWCPGTLTTKVVTNGFLYVGGNFHSTGSPTFYGSVDTEGDFLGNGTPTLYYRTNFNYNMIQSGTIAKTKWQEVKSMPTPQP